MPNTPDWENERERYPVPITELSMDDLISIPINISAKHAESIFLLIQAAQGKNVDPEKLNWAVAKSTQIITNYEKKFQGPSE